MKFYSLNIWIWADSSYVTICKDGRKESYSFTVNHIADEPDWHRLLECIRFFDAEFVYIAPRFDNADELTSEPTNDTGRYISGYRVFRDGSYREDFGSDR